MKKFYVNEMYDYSLSSTLPYKYVIVGLFSQCRTHGEGSFCGYYSSEYYLDTNLYAYYIAERGSIFDAENVVNEINACETPIHYNEIMISTHMWTKVIEAENEEEAIKLFAEGKWRKWVSPYDEVECISKRL